jgi:hypothetical protein
MARVHAHPRVMGPKMDSLSLRYFGLALVDPTDRYLRAWKPVPSCLQFDQQRVLSRSFSLLPLPTAAFSIMAKRKATTEELGARAESNGYKRGAHREKDSTRDNGKHNKKTKRGQNSMLDRYVSQGISVFPCELRY